MESKVRYVVKTSGSSKITPKNINIDGSDDPFYRYKMRELYAQVVGKGKMIKTVLLNIDDVAKDLKVPPAYMTAYLGYELNAQTKYDAKKPDRERASISGDIDADKMSSKIVSFIQEFVLCPKCKLPETTLSVDKKTQDINAACRSCGERSTLSLRDNFKRYIINHPHHFTVAKEEKAVRKKQEAAAKEAAQKQSEKDKDAESSQSDGDKKEKRKKSKNEDSNDEDDDVQWSVDVSSDAIKARRRELLPSKLASLVINEGGPEQVTPTKDFIEEVRRLEKEGKGDVIAEAKKLKKELEIDDATFVANLVKALFDTTPVDVTKQKVALLKQVITGPVSQLKLLNEFDNIASTNEEVLKKGLVFVKTAYDLEILEEESILKWYRSSSDTSIGVRGAVKKMVEWLESAEEEDDD